MEKIISGKNIVLGVCGGIAAYKSAELLRLFVKQGARVRVIMTRNAGHFVGPLTFEALSGQPVLSTLFEAGGKAAIRHIDWAEAADAVVVAPATANMIGKLACGIADDALSTFLLTVQSPVMVCPSMNSHMYAHKAVQKNLKTLRAHGCRILTPDAGELACGTTGPGRLPEPEVIADRLAAYLAPNDFMGKQVLVSAGPTREPMDPVRFISNPSTGKMGYAVARAAEYRGANVTLVSGPTTLAPPRNTTLIRVDTAQEMADAVFEHFPTADIIIKTAAVSDYRPKKKADRKIKKEKDEMQLDLVRNTDILKAVGRQKKDQILVGFAAETEALEKNALQKLAQKNLDMIVANRVDTAEGGFASNQNKATLFFKDGASEDLPLMDKEALAHHLLDRILSHCLHP